MSRFLQATFAISIFAANLGAQSPAPTSPSPAPPGRMAQAQLKSPALPAASPSASPTTEDLVNSLGPADLQAVISLLKSNFTNPEEITGTDLNRATVEGLLVRLPGGVMLLAGKENPSAVAPNAFYSEVIGGHIGYVRLGSLNNANFQALDKSLSGFAGKKVNALIVDLRSSQATDDLALAAEFAKRFCPRGKTIFTLRKPEGRSLFPEGVKPDLSVELSLADKRQIFQLSGEKGISPFVYEAGRPHMNEAALLAGTNPEVEAAEAAQQRRGRVPEKQSPHDPVLQRALDVLP